MTVGPRPGLRLIRGSLALVLLGVLATAFAVESLSPRRFEVSPAGAPEMNTGDDYALLAEKIDQGRASAIYLGLAIRDVPRDELMEVIAPYRLLGLATTPDISVEGTRVSILNARVVSNLSAGRYREIDYDPRLTRTQLDEILATGTLEEHAGDIRVVVPRETIVSDAGRYVLHADEENSIILVVPYSLSPLSAGDGVMLP